MNRLNRIKLYLWRSFLNFLVYYLVGVGIIGCMRTMTIDFLGGWFVLSGFLGLLSGYHDYSKIMEDNEW